MKVSNYYWFNKQSDETSFFYANYQFENQEYLMIKVYPELVLEFVLIPLHQKDAMNGWTLTIGDKIIEQKEFSLPIPFHAKDTYNFQFFLNLQLIN